jgi:hypothetical protein
MMKHMIAAVLVTLVVVSGPAMAKKDLHSGNEWLKNCTSKSSPGLGLCAGYLYGLGHGRTLMKDLGATLPYCMPKGVVTGQLRDIFVNYLQAHPETRHQFAGRLYLRAMKEKFPCPSR